MTYILPRRKKDTGYKHSEDRPWEDPASRQSSPRRGEGPQKKSNLLRA